VSLVAKVIPSDQIKHLPLDASMLSEKSESELPITLHFTDNNLTINGSSGAETDTLELVVFSNLTFALLLQLTSYCQITICALNAINQRNKLTSYRFNIQGGDITSAIKLLGQFSLDNKIEAAILQNAPKLAQPGLLVMDMDSTTIKIECIDEIAALAGVGEEVAAVTELAMQGELDFAQSLHQRVSKLTDAPEKILAEVANNIPLMEGLETLIQILKIHHWKIAIASGGFTYFADHLKELLNLDGAFANKLEIVDNKLTGKVLGDVVDAKVKAICLTALSKEFDIPFAQTVAMGDGANDLIMMAAANLGVAFHAKSIVLKQADTCINEAGLDCLIHWLK